MKALIQRVNHASLRIDGEQYCSIGRGLVVFLGLEKNDTFSDGERLLKKVLDYRVFGDAAGKMNCSLRDVNGDILLVSQFTLAADTQSGLRPSFSSAMPPAEAETLYEKSLTYLRQQHANVATGKFGADMKVSLENDGPVTFMLKS